MTYIYFIIDSGGYPISNDCYLFLYEAEEILNDIVKADDTVSIDDFMITKMKVII